ncbi:hypothetical protein ACFL54_00095 [Planctomycetota bacterium]
MRGILITIIIAGVTWIAYELPGLFQYQSKQNSEVSIKGKSKPNSAESVQRNYKTESAAPLKEGKKLNDLYKRIASDLQKGQALVVTVHVALCDNQYQGIVPVPASLGNGDDPGNNLYWGAMYGLYGEFNRAKDWKRVFYRKSHNCDILETVIYRKKFEANPFWRNLQVSDSFDLYLIGKAWRGRYIAKAGEAFTRNTFTDIPEKIQLENGITLNAGGQSHVVGFIGHNYLGEIARDKYPFNTIKRNQSLEKGAFILACVSYPSFGQHIINQYTHNLAMTKSFMAPESYTVRYLLDSLAAGNEHTDFHNACAKAYGKYQRISVGSAKTVFHSGD